MQAPLTQTTHRHHSHTHTHTQPCVEVGPLRRTNAATEQPAIRKNITLKKSATSIRSVHHKRGNRPPFLPHSVPTTTFSRSVRYYCPRVPQSRLYKHSQCSGCSLHQASKKAGLKKKKKKPHTCVPAERTERSERIVPVKSSVRASAISCGQPVGLRKQQCNCWIRDVGLLASS